jgi:hypothetical protein
LRLKPEHVRLVSSANVSAGGAMRRPLMSANRLLWRFRLPTPSSAVRWLPVDEPINLTQPIFSGGFSEHAIQSGYQCAQGPLALGCQRYAAMMRMVLRQRYVISHVECEDDTPLSRGAQELSLVVRVQGDPVIGCTRDIMPSVYQSALELPDRSVCIQV